MELRAQMQPLAAYLQDDPPRGRIEDSVLDDALCGHARSSVGGACGSVSIGAQRRAFERFPRFAAACPR
jgi:hypothetical protein